MQLTAINTAEAVFEAWWDPELSEYAQWDVEANEKTGTKISQWWCNIIFEWQNSADRERVLAVSRKYEKPVEVKGYDKLLLSLVLPNGCTVKICADTELGRRETESEPFGQEKQEVEMPLEGAEQLLALQLEIYATESASGMGWFNWAGLQDSEKLKDWLSRNRHFDADWEGSLYPLGTAVSFAP